MDDHSTFADSFSRARQHDGDAFREVMRRVGDALRRYVHRHRSPTLSTVIDVDDVLQDVALLLFERLDRFPADLDESEFAAYAIQITKHRLIDLARAHVPHAEGDAVDPQESASRTGSVTRADDHRKLREAVTRLPADQAAVVQAIVFDGRSVESTARSCAISPEAVRQRLARARSRLRELFGIDAP
jgi:RNA polymerase sigma factor (sigma-70 family)